MEEQMVRVLCQVERMHEDCKTLVDKGLASERVIGLFNSLLKGTKALCLEGSIVSEIQELPTSPGHGVTYAELVTLTGQLKAALDRRRL